MRVPCQGALSCIAFDVLRWRVARLFIGKKALNYSLRPREGEVLWKTMKPIICSPSELEKVIDHHQQRGANPAHFTLACPVTGASKFHRQTPADKASKADKRPNTLGEIVKHSDLSALVNFNYAGNVNAQRAREGVTPDFVAKDNWFRHVSPAIVEHKQTGERYVFVRVLKSLSPATFTVNGTETPRADLLSVLPASDLTTEERALYGLAPEKPSAQGIEKEIAPISVRLANVRQVVIDGFCYIVAAAPITVRPEPLTVTRPASEPVAA